MTQATPTVFATSAAKMSDDYSDGDQVFRSEADMKVWKNGAWIWDKTSSILADVRYYKP